MTLYVSNRDGDGKTDEMGHYKVPSILTSGDTLLPGLAVTQNSPLGMSILVSAGDFRVDTGLGYAYTGWNNAPAVVSLATSNASNPRIDTVVLYIDKSQSTSPSPPNNPGVAKVTRVTGTPNALPTAPLSSEIQTAVGAGNPYIVLADVRVNAAATQILNANITDRRTRMKIAPDMVTSTSILDAAVTTTKIAPSAVKTGNIEDNAVTAAKFADGAVSTRKFKPTLINSNFTPAGSRWNQTTTGTWQTVTNCSMTYTSGPTPERLFLTMSMMASKTAGNGEAALAVNGVRTQTIYLDSSWLWARTGMDYVVDVAANTTITLAVQTANLSGAGSVYVTNEVDRWMPKITGFSVYNGA